MASFEGFKKELLELQPGNRAVYHIGNLNDDRVHQTTVHKIAILCLGLQMLGLATLTAQRLDKARMCYYVNIPARAARSLQGKDLTRAWTVGQETLTAQS